jgi:hypothetical protein
MSYAAMPDGLCPGCAARAPQNRRVSGRQRRSRGPCATETAAWCKREAQPYTAQLRCKHRSTESDVLIQMILIWASTNVWVICTTVSCAMQVGMTPVKMRLPAWRMVSRTESIGICQTLGLVPDLSMVGRNPPTEMTISRRSGPS